MKRLARISSLALPILTGCAETIPKNMPLVFAETISVGINVGASTTEQGGDFSLGFKSKDVAVVPVVTLDKDGKPVPIESKSAEGQKTMNDAYSVLGQFSSDTSAAGRNVGLGKFFATGQAAVRLSDGFSNCL